MGQSFACLKHQMLCFAECCASFGRKLDEEIEGSLLYKPAEIYCVEDLYFLVRRDLLVDQAGDAALHNPVICNGD